MNMREVADIAGVSPATVSRIVNGRYRNHSKIPRPLDEMVSEAFELLSEIIDENEEGNRRVLVAPTMIERNSVADLRQKTTKRI